MSGWTPPPPRSAVGAGAVAVALTLNIRSAVRLIASGLVGPVHAEPSGAAWVLEDALDELRTTWPPLTTVPEPTFNARVGPATAEDAFPHLRSWYGYHETMPPQVLVPAVCGWYAVKDPHQFQHRLFCASVAGFIVFAGRIVSVHEDEPGVRWDVRRDAVTDAAYLHHRLPLVRGGPWRKLESPPGP